MNYEQANSVKHLAPDVMKMLEGLEWECSECKGKGETLALGLWLRCDTCNGKGRVKYSWTPQVGEWCIWKDKPYLIYEVEENLGSPDIGYKDVRIAALYDFHYVMRKSLTPILEWEVIEEVLEKAGYSLGIDVIGATGQVYLSPQGHYVGIYDKYYKLKSEATGKSRLIAVYKAVPELRRKLKCS